MKEIFENVKIEIKDDEFYISFIVGEGSTRQKAEIGIMKNPQNNIEVLCQEMISIKEKCLERINLLDKNK